jgi:TetR/AcrR family transcriptional repressor of nem operon
MARSKEFNKDDVVDKAINVFWSKGFEATSVQDLVNAMGINRGSIYNTFGDKAGLFDVAISRYQIYAPSQRLLNNANTGSPREEIVFFFDTLLDRHNCSEGQRGCLITNSIAELANRRGETADHFQAHFRKLEDALHTLIKRGQETGEITPWREARALSRSLLASAQGLTVVSKVNPGQETLSDIATMALSLLD